MLKKDSGIPLIQTNQKEKAQSMQVPTAMEAIPVISWNEAGWWDSGVIWLPRAQRIEKIFLYPDDVQIWLRKDGALEWISPESESKVLLCDLSHPQTEL